MAMDDVVIKEPVPISWSAILAGSFVAMGIWLFLYVLGTAIGGEANKAAPDTWAGIYTLVAPIIALFFGGLVAARGRGLVSRGNGMLHGLVVWGFSMVITVFMMGLVGGEFLFSRAGGGVHIPSGYSWAIAGAILGSLITALLGSSAGYPREAARTTLVEHREVRV